MLPQAILPSPYLTKGEGDIRYRYMGISNQFVVLLTISTSIFTIRIKRFKKHLCPYRYYKIINHDLYNNPFVHPLKSWQSRQIVLHY